jgi:hypothetical protein
MSSDIGAFFCYVPKSRHDAPVTRLNHEDLMETILLQQILAVFNRPKLYGRSMYPAKPMVEFVGMDPFGFLRFNSNVNVYSLMVPGRSLSLLTYLVLKIHFISQ